MATYELRFSRPVWDDPRNAWRVTGEVFRAETYLGVVEGLLSAGEVNYLEKHTPEVTDWKERMGPALVARWGSAGIPTTRWPIPKSSDLTHLDLQAATPEALRDGETVCAFEG